MYYIRLQSNLTAPRFFQSTSILLKSQSRYAAAKSLYIFSISTPIIKAQAQRFIIQPKQRSLRAFLFFINIPRQSARSITLIHVLFNSALSAIKYPILPRILQSLKILRRTAAIFSPLCLPITSRRPNTIQRRLPA